MLKLYRHGSVCDFNTLSLPTKTVLVMLLDRHISLMILNDSASVSSVAKRASTASIPLPPLQDILTNFH